MTCCSSRRKTSSGAASAPPSVHSGQAGGHARGQHAATGGGGPGQLAQAEAGGVEGRVDAAQAQVEALGHAEEAGDPFAAGPGQGADDVPERADRQQAGRRGRPTAPRGGG